jgi:uncharacterized membrane protein YfcA
MDAHAWQIIAVFVATLGASTFSGAVGGGGGFIMLPIYIGLGLSPQQAVATNKFAAFGIGIGSVAAFKKKSFENKKLLAFLLTISFLISLVVPHIFLSLSSRSFQSIIGLILIICTPLMISKKVGIEQKSTSWPKKLIGGTLICCVTLVQGVFSGGTGSLNNILLITFFGLTALQANATRRVSTLALNTFIIATLALTTNFIVFSLAVAGLVGSLAGGYLGSNIALKRGERFAKYGLAVFMVVSGIVLIATA